MTRIPAHLDHLPTWRGLPVPYQSHALSGERL
jgi:hypothetical protein